MSFTFLGSEGMVWFQKGCVSTHASVILVYVPITVLALFFESPRRSDFSLFSSKTQTKLGWPLRLKVAVLLVLGLKGFGSAKAKLSFSRLIILTTLLLAVGKTLVIIARDKEPLSRIIALATPLFFITAPPDVPFA